MEAILARLAVVEVTISTVGFKTGMDLCCNAALHRMEEFEAKSKFNVNRIVEAAERRQNEIISRNGLASKHQRETVKELVTACEARVYKQNKAMHQMEKGIQLLQQVEGRLTDIIRGDHKVFNARIEEVEEASVSIGASVANLQACVKEVTALEAKVMGIIDEAKIAGLRKLQTLRISSNAKIFRRRPVRYRVNPKKELGEQAAALKSLEAEVASISLKLQSQPASRSGGGCPMSLQSPVPVRGLPLVDLFPVPAEIVMPPAAARLDSPVGSTPSQADVVLACLVGRRSSIPAPHATPKHSVHSAQNIVYGRAVLRSVVA